MRWKNSWFGLREQTWDVLEGQQNETDTTGQEETNSFCKRRSHTFWPKSTQYAYLGETSVLVTSRFCFLVHGAKRPNRRTVVNEQTHSPWRVRWSESRSWRHTSSSATPSGAHRSSSAGSPSSHCRTPYCPAAGACCTLLAGSGNPRKEKPQIRPMLDILLESLPLFCHWASVHGSGAKRIMEL